MAPRKSGTQRSRPKVAKPRAAAAGTKPGRRGAGRAPTRSSRTNTRRAGPRVIPVEPHERNREAAPQGAAPAAPGRRPPAVAGSRSTRPTAVPAVRETATFVQLLPRDRESLLVFWQASGQAMALLRGDVGERTLALSRPTLRLTDEHGLRPEFILLPEDTRSCALKVDPRRLAYRVEYGYTLPSGEFRRLAESTTVRPPKAAAPGRLATASARFDAASSQPLTFDESRRRIEQAIRAGDWARAQAIAESSGVDVVAVLERRESVSSDVTVRGGASELHR